MWLAPKKGANIENVIFGNMHLKVWIHHTNLTNVEYHFFGIILILPSVTNLRAWYVVVKVLHIVYGDERRVGNQKRKRDVPLRVE